MVFLSEYHRNLSICCLLLCAVSESGCMIAVTTTRHLKDHAKMQGTKRKYAAVELPKTLLQAALHVVA